MTHMNQFLPATTISKRPEHKIMSKSPIVKARHLLVGALAAISLASALPALVSSPAHATDLDVSAGDSEGGRFVRIGLNKSVVVRLPADARDVIVGNPEIVDAVVRAKNTAYLFARKSGQTNIFFFDRDGQQILSLDIEVAQDVTAIRKLIRRTLPGTQITVDTVNESIVLGGIAQNALEAKTAIDLAKQFSTKGEEGVVNTIKVAGEDQVMLKVKVVEIQRETLKQFGVNFDALLKGGNFAFRLANINPFSSDLLSAAQGLAGGYDDGTNKIDSVLRAMESDGLLRTLAEPNLTAQTGKEAKFQAGGEFPFCASFDTTSQACTYEFKKFGVAVDFTPTVLEEGRINLKLKTDVSEIAQAANAVSVPSLNTRSAETTLELPSGGSMMIAGLIRESTRQYIKGAPGLKKLPVLGALFRSRDFIANETELVIIVTPYLVRATGEQQLVSPDKGFNPATDRQTLFMGRLNKVYGINGKKPDGTYHGNVGFIVE